MSKAFHNNRRLWKNNVIQYVQHMAVQGRLEVASMDYMDLVYKVNYLVQSSLVLI